MSEIRVLHKEDICLPSSADESSIINVNHGYNEVDGVKIPKGKRKRKVPLPTPLAREIVGYAEGSPSSFIFWSIRNGGKPISNNLVTKWREDAYQAIGIDPERNVVFHSLRHTFASITQDDLSGDDRMDTLGHSTMRMTDYYTHDTEKHIQKIGARIESVIPYGIWKRGMDTNG